MRKKDNYRENIFSSSAQGTIEYLVIIAIVVVIALIVVSLLLGQMGSASTTNEQGSKLYWSSQPLAITDSIVDNNGTILLVLKNNTSDRLSLGSVTVNGNSIYPADFFLAVGESKSIYLNKNNIASTSSGIILTYNTSSGLTKIQGGNNELVSVLIPGILPSDSVIYASPRDCFDTNVSLTYHPICSCDDLNRIRNYLTWDYNLMNNIDFRNCDFAYNTGNGWDPIGKTSDGASLQGTFNGQGYTISNLFINRPTTNYIALFGRTAPTATVINIGVIDVNIVGKDYTGGLVGVNRGAIFNSYTTGQIYGEDYVGGLIGYTNIAPAVTSNCYSLIEVSGGSSIGGFIGQNTGGNISNSYSYGIVTGSSNVGGFCGTSSSGTDSNNFWDMNTSGRATSTMGIGKTTTEMKIQSTFANAGWDFDVNWSMGAGINSGYPYLRSQR